MTVSFSKCLIDVFCSLTPVHRVNIRKGAQCRYASEVSYAGHIFLRNVTYHSFTVCACVCSFERVVAGKKRPFKFGTEKMHL